MADETVAAVQNLLRDQRGPLVEALRWATVIMSEIERDGRPESFDGEMVKVPMILGPQQGSGFTTEQGTLNTTRALSHDKTRIDTGIAHIPVSFTTKAALAAQGGDNSWIDLIPDKMRMAEEGLRRTINEAFLGNADGLLAAITATNGGSTTVTVGTTANFYQLYATRVIDVLQRSNGAVVAQGVTISDFDEALGTVLLGTSVSVTNAHGLYIENSYGNVIQGWGAATGTSGTFQNASKTTIPAWRGTDVTPSAVTDLTLGLLDKAERKAAQRSGTTPNFYVLDPACLDRFTQGLTVQAQWAGDNGQLSTGWEGVKYRNKVLIREYDMPAQTAFGIRKEDVKIYTRDHGPDWDERDGSMFKRFTRSLPFEAWLIWMLQVGFQRCNSQVKIGNLAQAA